MAAPLTTRVIVHLDLDCFYAQVEHRRLGIPQDQPLAVQQWGSLLAINYVARKFGIGRGDNVTEARKKCPQIHLPHVETLGENRKPDRDYDRTHQKAILRRYRMASKEIYEILGRFAPVCERAGIDEAYLDITDQVKARMSDLDVVTSDFCAELENQDTKVVGVHALEGTGKGIEVDGFMAFPLTEDERMFCVGAAITREIRRTIFEELGFTCSVGIAATKLVAKLASPLNKPNGQTILAPRFFQPLMEHFPLRKIRGLGGKLGRQLIDLYYKIKADDPTFTQPVPSADEKPTVTVSAFVESCTMDDLVKHLGRETAVYVRNMCAGDDGDDPVNANKTDVKAFMAAKQYDEKSQLQDEKQLRYWIPLLAEEVHERCEEEKQENKRFPSQVSINYTRVGAKTKSRNFTIALDADVETIVKSALSALQHDLETMFPCSSLSIHVKDFMPMGSRSASISTYFVKPTEGEQVDLFAAANTSTSSTRVTGPSSSSGSSKRKISAFFGPSQASTPTLTHTAPESTTDQSSVGPDDHPPHSTEPFFCGPCDQFVYEPPQEHADFHFALRLAKSLGSTTAPSVGTKRPRPHGNGGPMDAFLKIPKDRKISDL